MYLMAIHIPVYVDGGRYYAAADWRQDLLLTRDWVAKHFGGLTLLAPSLPLSAVDSSAMHVTPIGQDEGIRVVPSFDLRCKAREFWIRQRRQWMNDVRRELRRATVIQTSMTNIYRPLAFLAHSAGVKQGVTTVFVGPDMDVHARLSATVRGRIYCMIYDQIVYRAVRNADLTLLKEGLVFDRYFGRSKNAKSFCHTMYSRRDVVDEAQLEARLATLGQDRPLRAVYAGRFMARKGLREAIAAIGEARRQGVRVEYHLYGGGPEEQSLRRQVRDLRLDDAVSFHGFVDYGPEFIGELSSYDVLLFLPIEEDTPRMLYDAMAAGLPLVGSQIPFLCHRVKNDRMGVVAEIGDSRAAANHLRQLREEPGLLGELSRASRAAGLRHSMEEWYQHRAEWTRQALERRLSIGAPAS